MSGEKDWVNGLKPRLASELQTSGEGEWSVSVDVGWRLAYAHEILKYGNDDNEPTVTVTPGYETDMLVSDTRPNGDWIPRVVLECKIGSVTTHDALTYSAKASTHKHVHPYLRYGVLVGNLGSSLPGRLIRHGAYFDFMLVWQSDEPSQKEWGDLVEVLRTEIQASRTLQSLLSESRARGRRRIHLLHRPLILRE